MPKSKNSNQIEKIRHSLSHLLAIAVLKKFPGAKLGVGPATDNGFYYDFLLPNKIETKDLVGLEAEMRSLIKQRLAFKKTKTPPATAKKILKDQPFKYELIDELKSQKKPITLYQTGNIFTDLCAGPHIKNTKEIPLDGFKLWKIAGAYWRGDSHNQMLTRLYGLAFNSKKELDEHLTLLAEAAKRDHRKLGQELELFIFSDLIGPGLPLYSPKGAFLRQAIADYSRQLRQEMGYQEVYTPQINKASLFQTSGHYDKYKEDMFKVVSNHTNDEYFLKPMNCPQHTQIFASKIRSYQDLPVRLSDFANLYRDEKPGELSGLTRLRAFSQDDSHCFCREDQIKDEFAKLLKAINTAMKTYKMSYYIRLSLRDEKNKSKYLGNDQVWRKSQKLLEDLLKEKKIAYVKAEGEAAFYGPKMDLIAKDSLNREWQLSTIQIDFNMPARFNLAYIGQDGQKHTPVMIHSALIGSPERFLGILIEHYAGAFPLWLSPVQVKILPISKKHNRYASQILKLMQIENIRAETDLSDDKIGKKIRNAETQKIPYMLIVGDSEVKSKTVSTRLYTQGDQGSFEIPALIAQILSDINRKK